MLHGPYTKRINDQVIENGFFYFGLKHGRWIRLNKSDILQDKETYFLGWSVSLSLGILKNTQLP